MIKIVLTISCIVCFSTFTSQPLIAQVLFNETFGQSTTRLTSVYMPTGGFAWGDPGGSTNEKAIENNYYAVIAPANIKDAYPVPYYWFWTGLQPAGNTGG